MSLDYTATEESSLINNMEYFNHRLAEIGSHGSSLTLDQIPTMFGSENVWIKVPMVRFHHKQRTFVYIITTLFQFII